MKRNDIRAKLVCESLDEFRGTGSEGFDTEEVRDVMRSYVRDGEPGWEDRYFVVRDDEDGMLHFTVNVDISSEAEPEVVYDPATQRFGTTYDLHEYAPEDYDWEPLRTDADMEIFRRTLESVRYTLYDMLSKHSYDDVD